MGDNVIRVPTHIRLAGVITCAASALMLQAGAAAAGPGATGDTAAEASKATPTGGIARGVPVMDRPRPDFDALGIHAGSFLIFPQMSVKEAYNSNIYAVSKAFTSDLITTLSPSLGVRSDWNQHALNLKVTADSAFYKGYNKENYTEIGAGVDGRLDVIRDGFLTGAFEYNRVHEDRGDPNATASASEPTIYNTYTGRVGGSYGAGRLSVRVNGSGKVYRYDNTPLNPDYPVDADTH